MNHVVIGVDQSFTSSGVCVIDGGEATRLYTIKTSSENGDTFARANLVATKIATAIGEHGASLICLEGLAFSKFGNATRDLAGLQYAVIVLLRYKYNFEHIIIIPPNELKKFATGHGNASKDDMVGALPPHIDKNIRDQNYKKSTGLYDVTDAYWLARYAEAYAVKHHTK